MEFNQESQTECNEERLLTQSLRDQNVKHDTATVGNDKAYLTNWLKSVLYTLDILLDLSGKIISTSS
jgi:hypothetical protein